MHRLVNSEKYGGYSGMEWMATAAFLGALYCAVLGVFKRFRASMTFSMAEVEAVNAQEPIRAVYRPFSSDAMYSFNAVQERQNGNVPPSYLVAPKLDPARPRPQPVLPLAPLAPLAPVAPADNQPQTPSTSADTPKSESKPSSSSKKSKSGDKTDKTKDKSGGKVPGKELTEKEKLKKEKAKKERHEKKKKEEKLKLEKEKKLKAKEEKKLKGKAPAQAVASVTIDEAAASNQAAMNPKVEQAAMNPMVNQAVSKNPIARNPVALPPPYQEAFSKVGQNVTSPNAQKEPVASQGGFTSSWDQVAEHRQNMQRDVKTFSSPAKNLRAMGNQNPSDEKQINSLYMTSNNSPRNNNPAGAGRSGRYSPPSDYSGEDSGTEA